MKNKIQFSSQKNGACFICRHFKVGCEILQSTENKLKEYCYNKKDKFEVVIFICPRFEEK